MSSVAPSSSLSHYGCVASGVGRIHRATAMSPSSLRVACVRLGRTVSSISFSRNAASYFPRPRPRSQTTMSMTAPASAVAHHGPAPMGCLAENSGLAELVNPSKTCVEQSHAQDGKTAITASRFKPRRPLPRWEQGLLEPLQQSTAPFLIDL
jgi:hypothetical protein